MKYAYTVSEVVSSPLYDNCDMLCAVGVMFTASFAMLCPDGYGYVKETMGESMEGWRCYVLVVVAFNCLSLINSGRQTHKSSQAFLGDTT